MSQPDTSSAERLRLQSGPDGDIFVMDYNEISLEQAEEALNEFRRRLDGRLKKSVGLLIKYSKGAYPDGLKEIWLNCADEINPIIKGMAIVTENVMVMVAAKTYMIYLKFKSEDARLEVKSFKNQFEAERWLKSL